MKSLWNCSEHGLVEDPHGAGECPHFDPDAPQGFCGRELSGPVRVVIIRRVTLTPAEYQAEKAEQGRRRYATA
jgi:hypothetical protein